VRFFLRGSWLQCVIKDDCEVEVHLINDLLLKGRAELTPELRDALGNEVFCKGRSSSLLIRLYDSILTFRGSNCRLELTSVGGEILALGTFRATDSSLGTYYLRLKESLVRVSQANCVSFMEGGEVKVRCEGDFRLELMVTPWSFSAVRRSDDRSPGT